MKWELLKIVRRLMLRGRNWKDEWEERKQLVVRELGRRIAAGE